MATGNSDSYGTSLDNVSVTAAIPEPSTYALMFGGLAAIGSSRGAVARAEPPRRTLERLGSSEAFLLLGGGCTASSMPSTRA